MSARSNTERVLLAALATACVTVMSIAGSALAGRAVESPPGAATTAVPMNLQRVAAGSSNRLPHVEIVLPGRAGGYMRGADAHFRAQAWDRDGKVVEVRFYVDEVQIGVAHAPPYAITWFIPETNTWSFQMHYLKAVAVDDDGGKSESEPTQFGVSGQAFVAPLASIQAPESGSLWFAGEAIPFSAEFHMTYGLQIPHESAVDFYVNRPDACQRRFALFIEFIMDSFRRAAWVPVWHIKAPGRRACNVDSSMTP